MIDFSLCRQRRLYLQPSGGWVSSERAPSHLLPSTCPARNINNEHGNTTDPTNQTTHRQRESPPTTSHHQIMRSCCPRAKVCFRPRCPTAKGAVPLDPSNQVNQQCNQLLNRPRSVRESSKGAENEKRLVVSQGRTRNKKQVQRVATKGAAQLFYYTT